MCGSADLPEIRLCLHARSVSKSLRDGMPRVPADGRVLSVFRRACIIQYGRDGLLALVAPELGNGPLNVLMEYAPDGWVDLQPGMPAQIQSGLLRLGELEVSLDTADMWEPCPDWERLRPKAGRILSKLDQVLARLNLWTLGGTLLVLLQDPSQVDSSWADIIHARARGAAEAMWAGWRGDDVQLGAGAGQLGGLGSGLTPAGDDFMLGTMLCAWLAHPAPKRYCGTVLDACASRTTILSRAFLRSTAAGECSAPWHRLLEALEGGSGKQLDTATQEVLSSGHTSGADALAGFLWMGLRVLEN